MKQQSYVVRLIGGRFCGMPVEIQAGQDVHIERDHLDGHAIDYFYRPKGGLWRCDYSELVDEACGQFEEGAKG